MVARCRRLAAAVALAAGGLSLVGCEMDSFIDPSVVGRWENTPIIVPILDRIDSIESDTGEYVEISQVRPEDLTAEASPYRIGAGDILQAQIYAIDQEGARTGMELIVDPTGAVNIPQVGRVSVLGMTSQEAEHAVARAMMERGVVGEGFGRDTSPVLIQVVVPRQLTYSVFGSVRVPSRFQIPYPDYRLLEALTDAGGLLSPTQKYVYVIRQVPLSEGADAFTTGSGRTQPGRNTAPATSAQPSTPASPGEDILDLIDRLTEPEPGAVRRAGAAPVGMAALGGSGPASINGGPRFIPYDDPQAAALAQNTPANAPPIDLIDDFPAQQPAPGRPVRVDLPADAPAAAQPLAGMATEWRFIDGRWQKVLRDVKAPVSAGQPEGEDPLQSGQSDAGLMTQRVIQVPVAPLLQGSPQYNIVIRPQDVISVPPAPTGYVYLGGQLARPGVFMIEPISELTLQRAMVTAGGMNAIGIPERVDLIRRVGDNKQAVIRLNARAIWEGTQPDILLKPDDVLNFGTNFWATPLAVIRGGFRASYGFGFLLDRNFGNDVFGAPPTNIGGR
jgi:polysaccharide export outer membrane protein